MQLCGATFDENSVPLGQGGLRGILNAGTNPLWRLRATPPKEEIFWRTQCEAPPVFSFPVARSHDNPRAFGAPPLRGNCRDA